MDRLIHPALSGKPVERFSPTNKLMAETWRELRATLAPVTRDKSEQEKRLELLGGGSIELWSLDSPDASRGRKYATVVIDEAAMISTLEQAWQQSIRKELASQSITHIAKIRPPLTRVNQRQSFSAAICS
jgi:hypothetical protein